jgi:predicted MPP superfamily phosphohydrolase
MRKVIWKYGPWVLGWATISLLAAWLHVHVWLPEIERGDAQPMAMEGFFKRLENFVQMCVLPSWVFIWRFFGRFHSFETALAANAIGWGTWTIIAMSIVRIVRAISKQKDIARKTKPGLERMIAVAADAGLPSNPDRRRFLVGAAIGVGTGGAAAGFGRATLLTPWDMRIAKYEIPIRGLHAGLDGFRIVQISDTHLGPRVPRDHVERACQMAMDLKPDLIALTGDYIHMGTWYTKPAVEIFARMLASGASRCGVVATLGNHEFYGDAALMVRLLKEAGIRVLENHRCFIRPGSNQLHDASLRDEEELCICGVSDLLEGTIDAGAALAGVGALTPRIMLAHNPDTSEAIAKDWVTPPRVDLMLSGHTHGGQIVLPVIGPPIVPSDYGYAYGLLKTSLCPLILTSGVGMSIMPLRVNAPPEIVEVTLKKGK